MSRPAIGMADALEAASRLGVKDPAGLAMIVELLGLGATVEKELSAAIDRAVSVSSSPAPAPTHDDKVAPPPIAPSPPSGTSVEELSPDVPAALPHDAPRLMLPTIDAPDLGYEPPVPVHRLRPALAALVRRPRRSDRPDLPALIRAASTFRPTSRVPFRMELSLNRGVTVVADIGPAMTPYLADVDFMVEQIRQVVGRPRSAVVWCDDEAHSPLSPITDRPAIVISSLGKGFAPTSPGARQRWRALLSDSSDAVALVPHRDPPRANDSRTVSWDSLVSVRRHRG